MGSSDQQRNTQTHATPGVAPEGDTMVGFMFALAIMGAVLALIGVGVFIAEVMSDAARTGTIAIEFAVIGGGVGAVLMAVLDDRLGKREQQKPAHRYEAMRRDNEQQAPLSPRKAGAHGH